ncbi:response regulator transcription factor [Methyloversatilis sp.]|uniref:response regulator n=1 Tax=Methyloversatilis sp. TaxID=2569862 RepID=UPI002735D6F5|nr:response regulator transcription factor [Methyloversatilis sp.]MDP2870619.1 response regulator transcription factor [Methyloversatilis sp.]MDP3287735.1 response regulator transcription factor [Methyloversatilis sp.]MDP3456029.1 response regulator transcription factor [Methyloversatilis sp.]MDP3579757.1 response regulator transcription factor [Methyloversatilis sp.]MDP3873321.1 response regulator transcription factor [Methyloversatilis sp.]
MNKRRILLADDHQIVRNGLRQLINGEADLEVCAEAATSAETLTLLRQQDFDLLLLDISMPDRDGMDTLRLLRTHRADLPVLIISAYAEEQYALNMLRAGANGYIRKDADVEDILTAIRTVLRGRRYVSDVVADLLTQRLNGDNDAPAHQQLSEREFQVLHKLATGKSVTEIAEELFISVKSVSTYRSRLLTKLNLKSNAELTYYALKNGLIE